MTYRGSDDTATMTAVLHQKRVVSTKDKSEGRRTVADKIRTKGESSQNQVSKRCIFFLFSLMSQRLGLVTTHSPKYSGSTVILAT